MGYVKIEQRHKQHYVIDELKNKYGYTDLTGKSYEELKFALAKLRAMEVKVNNPENNWF